MTKMESYYGYALHELHDTNADFLYLYAKDAKQSVYFLAENRGQLPNGPKWIWRSTDYNFTIGPLLTRLDTSKKYTFHSKEDNEMWEEIMNEEKYKYTNLGKEIL